MRLRNRVAIVTGSSKGIGRASEVSLLELPRAFKLFTKKFPGTKKFIKSTKDIIRNATAHRFYKIVPSRIVLLDEVNFPNDTLQELKINL